LGDDRTHGQLFAQIGDVSLQRLDRGCGRSLAPQLLGEPVCREYLTAVNNEQREQRTLLWATQHERPPVVGDVKRSKYPEIHASPR
jgi:hypothetical protein